MIRFVMLHNYSLALSYHGARVTVLLVSPEHLGKHFFVLAPIVKYMCYIYIVRVGSLYTPFCTLLPFTSDVYK